MGREKLLLPPNLENMHILLLRKFNKHEIRSHTWLHKLLNNWLISIIVELRFERQERRSDPNMDGKICILYRLLLFMIFTKGK